MTAIQSYHTNQESSMQYPVFHNASLSESIIIRFYPTIKPKIHLTLSTKTLAATSKKISLSLSGHYSKLIQKCSVESGLFICLLFLFYNKT